MSVIEVSITAGDILLALEQRGGMVRLGEVPCAGTCAHAVLFMALGWLFKEGWITMHPAAGDWIVKARVMDQGARAAPWSRQQRPCAPEPWNRR